MPIKIDMDMPKCCMDCRFFERTTENVSGLYITHYCCYVSGEIVAGDFDKETKLISCPLKEVK